MLFNAGYANAASNPVKKWMVANWEISELSRAALAARNQWSLVQRPCSSVLQQRESAHSSRTPTGRSLPRKTDVDISVDAKPVGRYEARAFDGTTVEIVIPSSLVPALQNGDVVELDFGRARYSFPLMGSRKGLKALLECGAEFSREHVGQVTIEQGSYASRPSTGAPRARLRCSKFNTNMSPVDCPFEEQQLYRSGVQTLCSIEIAT